MACAFRGAGSGAEEGFLEGAGGARIFYRVVGTGAETAVAVHGGPGAGMNAFFSDLLPLAAGYRVIFYDQRGGGRSDLPADTALLDARHHVEDLEAVRRHFGLERMSVVAHSFGPSESDVAGVAPQREWVDAFPNARLLLVPDAGKGALADRPDVVFPAIEEFLKGEWPAAAVR
ncbi:MAG TPA: alpha/beta fold hydrolase [Thermoanaerobaculia bacterium]|nr:alpha/beta fold hydrolase [Thermoanaerobaculia bacterium]